MHQHVHIPMCNLHNGKTYKYVHIFIQDFFAQKSTVLNFFLAMIQLLISSLDSLLILAYKDHLRKKLGIQDQY